MIGGYRILHKGCSRCGINRTAELGTSHVVVFCFNCKLQVPGDAPTFALAHPTREYSELSGYHFSVAERLRLEAYRGAIRAGVYTDEITPERAAAYATTQ
jgi:hypothetical protein